MLSMEKGFSEKEPEKDVIDVSVDEEKVGPPRPESLDRPVFVTSAFYVGLALCLAIILIFGLGVSVLLTEYLWDGDLTRFALLAVSPFLLLMGLFTVSQMSSSACRCLRLRSSLSSSQTCSRLLVQ